MLQTKFLLVFKMEMLGAARFATKMSEWLGFFPDLL
jgi:hypothetical protein